MKRILSAILIISILMFSGCWDSREINELALVMAVGIDKAPDTGDYIVTVQIVDPKMSSQQGTGNAGTSGGIYVLTAQGKTLFAAIRELSRVSSKRIMWAHNYIIIIGEDVARDSITPVVDLFMHDPELRVKTAVVVSKGNAMDYLAIKSGMEEIPAVSFYDIYNYGYLSAEYIRTDMLKLNQSYCSKYSQPVISAISFSDSRYIPSEGKSSNITQQVQFGGCAVFNKDRMVDWLTPEETRGLAWVMNDTKDTVITVREPDYPEKFLSVETKNVHTDMITKVKDGVPSVTFKIKGTGNIIEEDSGTTQTLNELKNTVEGLVEQKIVNDINAALNKVQKDYKCDVIGMAKAIHGQHNNAWENTIKYKWDEIYPQMQVTIDVRITIMGSVLKQKTMDDINKY